MQALRYHRVIHHVILEQLRSGNKVALRISGKSMQPLIKEGALVSVEACDPEYLSMGDIVTFERDDLSVTHRVLWVMRRSNGTIVRTKGDNEVIIDRPVSTDQVIGKVVAIKRGNQILRLNNPSWRVLNRLLGMAFLMETISILLYRFTLKRIIPRGQPVHTALKPPHLYRRFRTRGLSFATRIIASFHPPGNCNTVTPQSNKE